MLDKILSLAHKISTEEKAAIFVDYSGHVKEVDIRIHANGWKKNDGPTHRYHFYVNDNETKDRIEALKALEAIDNGLQPVSRIGECRFCWDGIYDGDKYTVSGKQMICIKCAEEFKRGSWAVVAETGAEPA